MHESVLFTYLLNQHTAKRLNICMCVCMYIHTYIHIYTHMHESVRVKAPYLLNQHTAKQFLFTIRNVPRSRCRRRCTRLRHMNHCFLLLCASPRVCLVTCQVLLPLFFAYKCVCVCVYIYIYSQVLFPFFFNCFMYVCICIYIYIYIYIHTHIHIYMHKCFGHVC